MEAVYEQDFRDCSYGFRPGRSAHQALEILWKGLMNMGGGWVLDLDIQGFFDTLDHRCLQRFLDQRVRDGVPRRAIDKWLKAGVLEDGGIMYPDAGTPQGGVVHLFLRTSTFTMYWMCGSRMWSSRDFGVEPSSSGTLTMLSWCSPLRKMRDGCRPCCQRGSAHTGFPCTRRRPGWFCFGLRATLWRELSRPEPLPFSASPTTGLDLSRTVGLSSGTPRQTDFAVP